MSMDTNIDSSHISDFDETKSDAFGFDDDDKKRTIEDIAEDEYVKNVVMDRIIKYIKIDDIVKQKEEEHKKTMKHIKETRQKLEDFIIMYLDKINEEYVMIGKQNKLTKHVKETKEPIKINKVETVIRNEIKQRELCKNEEELNIIVSCFLKNIEESRQIRSKKSLVRSNPEIKKGRKTNKQAQ